MVNGVGAQDRSDFFGSRQVFSGKTQGRRLLDPAASGVLLLAFSLIRVFRSKASLPEYAWRDRSILSSNRPDTFTGRFQSHIRDQVTIYTLETESLQNVKIVPAPREIDSPKPG
jgi:hypothetical protein